MQIVRITAGPYVYLARLELERAPLTCAAWLERLPFGSQLVQARWSGESGWVPLGQLDLGLTFENPTSHPAPGELLFYPGGVSEAELLFPYGPTCFASKAGQLAGNHFLSIVEGRSQLAEMGRHLLWRGALPLTMELAPAT